MPRTAVRSRRPRAILRMRRRQVAAALLALPLSSSVRAGELLAKADLLHVPAGLPRPELVGFHLLRARLSAAVRLLLSYAVVPSLRRGRDGSRNRGREHCNRNEPVKKRPRLTRAPPDCLPALPRSPSS